MPKLYIGTLVRYVQGRFGVIAPHDESPTVFVHSSKLWEGAKEGDELEFSIGNGDRGDFAYACRKIETKKAAKSKVR